MPGTLVFLVRVWSHEVEVELVGVHFDEEVATAGEVFQIEELIFFEPVHGFDIALVGVRGRGDAYRLAVAEHSGEVALELAAVVGLPHQVTPGDAVAVQMLLNA